MVGRGANYAFSVTGGLVRADLGPNQSPDQPASFFRILALSCQENGTSRLLIDAHGDPSTIPDADQLYEAVLAMFDAGVPKNCRVAIVVRSPDIEPVFKSLAHAAELHGVARGADAAVFKSEASALRWLNKRVAQSGNEFQHH